ncbi:unnamed protein product [Vitrella brassicaformis CCMP3155]|uniref:Uncharacterized protein n=1 Tax=Vitrella brassicaformis (strain CCMP3155) TaxID=1169540 RepID=A0A0G4ECB0_VITBC|nr:unnamed protein product [Vitrella brassicaformis CCMP3155]|eukprot:CEL92978.1 unnamed protein product [Vitrella brassicaformis CCMP3155]
MSVGVHRYTSTGEERKRGREDEQGAGSGPAASAAASPAPTPAAPAAAASTSAAAAAEGGQAERTTGEPGQADQYHTPERQRSVRSWDAEEGPEIEDEDATSRSSAAAAAAAQPSTEVNGRRRLRVRRGTRGVEGAGPAGGARSGAAAAQHHLGSNGTALQAAFRPVFLQLAVDEMRMMVVLRRPCPLSPLSPRTATVWMNLGGISVRVS